LGLFAGRDLEKHTMVIEYIGELIRNEVANKREKLYEQQNRGIYMFRLDEENVVDATMSGCLARYINHSCEVMRERIFCFSIYYIFDFYN
jgi:SET domain-containing protein